MKCPKCQAASRVVETRAASDAVVRKRECENEHRFFTEEKFARMTRPKRKKGQLNG